MKRATGTERSDKFKEYEKANDKRLLQQGARGEERR